ncbi:MAG: hypothetical protein WAW36_18950 [Methylovulum miyakonense]|uniref:hypothetical protein n=1 Tax=Methylovulum miyakonense TaxID=645578 RepID=UPI003BB6545B
MKKKPLPIADFKGFDDFIEVFKSGTHTDHAGNSRTWTNADIDQIIANSTGPVPIVIGHPKEDASSPAYGWKAALKREGDTLLAQFNQVEPQFEAMVQKGLFKNRSIRILKGANGLRLGHVGFLGASPPAIEGLKEVDFAGGDEVFDFSAEWISTSIMAKMMRNLREFFIAQYGQEKTDAVLPNYDIDELNRLSEQQYQDDVAEREAGPTDSMSSFSQQQGGAMTTITQAQLDAETQAKAKAQQESADFAAQNQTLQQQLATERATRRRTEYQAIVDSHITRGVKPALLEGAVDFMLQQDDAETAVFEFSVGDAKKTAKPVDFVKGLLAALPVAVKLGKVDFSGFDDDEVASDFAAPQGQQVDQDALVLLNKIKAYQAQHQCDYKTAVLAVGK